MKRFTLSILAFLSVTLAFSQIRQTIFLKQKDISKGGSWSVSIAEQLNNGPFIACSVVWPRGVDGNWVVEALQGVSGNEIHKLEKDAHNVDQERLISELFFLPKETKHVRFSFLPTQSNAQLFWAEIHFYNPGHSRPGNNGVAHFDETRGACPCPVPAYESRSDWCPSGNCPPDPTPTFTVVTHLIVHHSAGPSTSSDWQAVVRSIWDFHVNVNGWDDIGYNWLIDPTGTIYQGRGDNVLGAHFCGKNGGTMGVCMLGNYQEDEPAQEALFQLEKLLAWKSCDASIDPLATAYHPSSGLNLYRISGHRDGCSTECPGDNMYVLLPQLRQAVRNRIDNLCSSEPAAPAAPTQLSAYVINPNQVQLSWTDNADNETGFILERSEVNNKAFAQLAAMPENTVAFDDLTTFPGIGYYYRVRATAPGVFSDFSNEVYVFTGATAYDEQNDEKNVLLFPNPANAEVTLQINVPGFAEGKLLVYDSFGQLALQQPIAGGENSLNTESLSPGLYLLNISSKDVSLFRKLMVD